MYGSKDSIVVDSVNGMDGPDWILDDNLLRDEGVLFGQTQSDKNQKVDAIRDWYLMRNTVLLKEIGFIDQKILEYKAFEEDYNHKLSELYAEQLELSKIAPDNFNSFVKKVLSTILFATILVAIFPSIYGWVSWRGDYAFFLALGVFLFGSISLFGNKSIVYFTNQDVTAENRREFYKILLEEFFVPFISSIFLIVYGFRSGDLLDAVLLWVLLFTVFLFAGKGLIVSIYSLRNEFHAQKDNFRHRKLHNKFIKDKYAIICNLKKRYNTNREGIEALEREKFEKELQRGYNEGEADRKVALFESEYALAFNFSQTKQDESPYSQ